MFSLEQVLFSTVVGIGASLIVLYVAARVWRAPFDVGGAVVLSVLVGASILVWRLGANVPQLNDDPIPVTSPNDILCPVVTYVVLSVYVGLKTQADDKRSRRERALLTLVSLAVNIVTI
jgi:hypothetical protein